MTPVTFEVPGRDSLTFDVSRLDFATREELLDAFSADGARVITVSDKGVVRIWPADGNGAAVVVPGFGGASGP